MHKSIFISLFVILSIGVFGQNGNSVFWNSYLRLNPAYTGLMTSKWRLVEHHRSETTDLNPLHWNIISFDFKKEFTKTAGNYGLKIEESTGRTLGIGFYDDRANYGNQQSRYISDYFSLAYHRALKKGSVFSLGIQPGFMRTDQEKYFDLNAGLLYGIGSYDCWAEDQYHRFQIGFSAYHITRDFADTLPLPGREFNLHFGQLIKGKNLNFVINGRYRYTGMHEMEIGTYALFFPIVHYKFFDRGRLGIHYRSSNHLVLSAGTRFYGRGAKSITLDGVISYDLPMKFLGFESPYHHGWEIGIVISPFKKCWSLSPCGN